MAEAIAWRILKFRITETSLVDRPANDQSTIEHMELAKRLDDDLPEVPGMAPEEVGALRKFFGTIFPGLAKKDYSSKEREVAADKNQAMSDGSFPIKTHKDVENAVKDWGRAGSKDDVKAHIVRRAKALAATDKLPNDWEGSTQASNEPKAKAEMSELRKALDGLNDQLKKGLYSVGDLAQIVGALHFLGCRLTDEAAHKNRSSELPDKVNALRDQLGDVLVELADEAVKDLKETQKMALDKSVREILEKYELGDLLKKADAVEAGEKPAVAAAPAAVVVPADIHKGDNSAEMQALVQGCHDALAAAGCPKHDESEGGDDVSEGKADKCLDMIKAAGGVDEATVKMFEETLGMAKRGRHSAADMKALGDAHDLVNKMGAKCMAKADSAVDLKKMRKEITAELKSEFAELKKSIAADTSAKDAEIAKLQAELAKRDAEIQPLPAGPGGRPLQLRSVDKDGTASAYVAPGSQPVAKVEETVTAPNGAQVPRIITHPKELLNGIKKIQEAGGVGGIEGLMTS